IEELCNERRLLHADLQKVGDSLRQKISLDLSARYVLHLARRGYGRDADMREYSGQVAEAQIDVRFHRYRGAKPGFKILKAQLMELRQRGLVHTMSDSDFRMVMPEYGQCLDDVGT